MRSQASKTVPKKGPAKVKAGSPTKQAKKKTPSPKKVKNLVKKTLVKNPKKATKDDSGNKNNDDAATTSNDGPPDSSKSGPSKGTASRSNSPTKKAKKDPKERKDPVKSPPGTKKVVTKKIIRKIKKTKLAAKEGDDSDDIKYKLNLDASKTVLSKCSKSKTIIKKANQKKNMPPKKQEKISQEKCVSGAEQKSENDNKEEKNQSCTKTDTEKTMEEINDRKEESKLQPNNAPEVEAPNSNDNNAGSSNMQTQKVETERPPKFFTSSRSSRMVDIDVKFCKTSKGSMSVSERFISMKPDDTNKDKNVINTFVSQGPEVDVYTFTEKVDSPKSILSDFRNPINKNIGRVRPIARVKGTVIDKKDPERKKYSPHRPIEEVVKQLKANKRSEDLSFPNQYQDSQSATSTESGTINSEKDSDESPKPIVSKSYKMVARKSSITGKPFSPIKFIDQEPADKSESNTSSPKKKTLTKTKKQQKTSLSDDEFDTAKFALNKKSFNYSSSDESVSESNDDDTKESSGSDAPKNQRRKNKKYKKITDSAKKNTNKELRELSKDSLVDLKDDVVLGGEKPSKRRLKLLSMWSGPKKHRMASLNALAKVHCLYENESRTHMELGLMKTIDRPPMPSTSKAPAAKKKEPKTKEPEKSETSTSESEYENKRDKKDDSSESSDDNPPQRTLRGVPGIRSAGKYWDPKSSTSSSEDSEMEFQKTTPEKKKTSSKTTQVKTSDKVSDTEKPPAKMKKTAGVPVKKKRNRSEVVMDLKDMVVQKRMASLNATAILAASYEKRSPKSNKDDTTSDSCSDESYSQKSKNGVSSGVKSEVKHEDTKNESEDNVLTDSKQKVEVIVNQDTDVTITGVYSTHHHEGFCTVSGMQYRISSTSHTQTTATANCEKEGCSRDDARYTPLSALSSMQPPADAHKHPHPVPELGGLARRAGCSSAFSAPSPSAHHEPGYYQPAGPMIKESGADAERALTRYHPPHYHAPHPPVLQQYGPYYPPELCYGRYYRPPGPPYHMPPQPDAQMVGVGSEPYPPPQYYGTPPCYQHSPQRIPYVEYRGCPCPLNACPKNVLIGLATGKAPTGVGPDALAARAPPGGPFRPKLRACVLDTTDTHGSGKDPPLEPEPPAAADAPHPCPLPAIGGASPKRELYDVRDKIRLVGDIPGPAEALGPPSPARGSAGACAPQPPPVAPRRARLGKEAARKSLADTGQFISTPPQPPPTQSSDADDDVMAISPPACAPIDLSSSDERTTPLVDVKKENEGHPCATLRKNDAPALREQNTTVPVQETTATPENAEPKAVKRRYSRPKLEIDMNNIQLEESCKTNGIGEHVKLQKRRKVSGEQTNTPRVEPVAKEPKKRTQGRRTPKTPNSDKKPVKRKLENATGQPKAKRMLLAPPVADDTRLKDVAVPENDLKPKTKSALLLDNLLRKNSIDRDITLDEKLNPAELFLTPDESVSPKESKKTLNINNNIVENTISGVRPNTIAAVTQLIEKKLACKKLEKVNSKITHSLKSVLKPPTDKLKLTETPMLSSNKCKAKSEKDILSESSDVKAIETNKDNSESLNDNLKDSSSVSNKISAAAEDGSKSAKVPKATQPKASLNNVENKTKLADESHISLNETAEKPVNSSTDIASVSECDSRNSDISNPEKTKRSKLTGNKATGQTRNKSIERVAKLLGAKKPVATENVNDLNIEKKDASQQVENLASNIIETTTKPVVKRNKANGEIKTKSIEKVAELLGANKVAAASAEDKEQRLSTEHLETKTHPEKMLPKRCKLNGELKEEKKKKVEKVVKLLVSKKPAIKTDEAMELVEDACASPLPTVGRRTKRRRSGALTRRPRRPLAPLAPPAEHRGPPRWSNGWHWDGEPYVNKVYLNNDSRLDRTARCWSRMCHQSGDSVARGDCVLLKASSGRAQQPFVARVASLWENPEDGEMMVSLVWYYRPEHTARGREEGDAPDEVFASRHRDANSVACIEDKCYVLTFNEYCRYRKRLKAAEEGIRIQPSIVPPLPPGEAPPAVQPTDTKLPPGVAADLVLFCRKIYDFRSKKIQVPNK